MREIVDVLVFGILLICSMMDFRTKMLPTYLLCSMSIVTILFVVIEQQKGWLSICVGLGIGILFLLISWLTQEAVGFGDSWMICNLGIYLGGVLLLEVLMAAMFCSGLYSLVGIVWKHWNRRKTIPFIPFLMIAYIGVVIV